MRRVLVIGAGLAGFTAAAELRRLGHGGEVIVVGDEERLPYQRPPLTKDYLAGETRDLTVTGAASVDVTWMLGRKATGLDLEGKTVSLATGAEISYDALVIATGVSPATIAGLPTIRTIDDADSLRARLTKATMVTVVGAGFLGSELAATLRQQGKQVSVVDRDPQPLARVLGAELGERIARLHQAHGIRGFFGTSIAETATGETGIAMTLHDGTVIRGDLAVAALGSKPSTGWLAGSGLDCADGLKLDSEGWAAPGVTAAGDVAIEWVPYPEARSRRVEHYSNAIAQGKAAARTLLGLPRYDEDLLPSFWSRLYGVMWQGVGHTGDSLDFRLAEDTGDGRIVGEYYDSGSLVGAVCVGRPRALVAYRRRLLEGQR